MASTSNNNMQGSGTVSGGDKKSGNGGGDKHNCDDDKTKDASKNTNKDEAEWLLEEWAEHLRAGDPGGATLPWNPGLSLWANGEQLASGVGLQEPTQSPPRTDSRDLKSILKSKE